MALDCPRCESRLERFTLGAAEAVTCRVCGYAGLEADHSGTRDDAESWDDAIERFRRKHS